MGLKSIWDHPITYPVVAGLIVVVISGVIAYLYYKIKPTAPEQELSYIANTYPVVSAIDTDMKVYINNEAINEEITGITIAILNTGTEAIKGTIKKEIILDLIGNVRILTVGPEENSTWKYAYGKVDKDKKDNKRIIITFVPPAGEEWFINRDTWIEIRAKISGKLDLDKGKFIDMSDVNIPDLQRRQIFRSKFALSKQPSTDDLNRYVLISGVLPTVMVFLIVIGGVVIVLYKWKPQRKTIIGFCVIAGLIVIVLSGMYLYGKWYSEVGFLQKDLPTKFTEKYLR